MTLPPQVDASYYGGEWYDVGPCSLEGFQLQQQAITRAAGNGGFTPPAPKRYVPSDRSYPAVGNYLRITVNGNRDQLGTPISVTINGSPPGIILGVQQKCDTINSPLV
jgi:hypothetical protein